MKQVVMTKSGPPEVLQIRDAPDPIPRGGVWRLDADKIAQKFPIDGGAVGDRHSRHRLPRLVAG